VKVIYAREQLENSIFLAGPTPREEGVPSWRPRALELLEKINFNGKVFVPEDRNGKAKFDYDDQIHWEWKALEAATIILFWIPREIETMPAFTTNVEFGLYAASGKILLGYPPEAQKMRYLGELAKRYNVPTYSKLEDLVNYGVIECYRRGK
jgi:hypothetical protein